MSNEVPLPRLMNLYRFSRNPVEKGQLYIQIRQSYPDAQIQPLPPISFDVEDLMSYEYPKELVPYIDVMEAWYSDIPDNARVALIPYLDMDVLLDEDALDMYSDYIFDQIVIIHADRINVDDADIISDVIVRNLSDIVDVIPSNILRRFINQVTPSMFRSSNRKDEILRYKRDPSSFLQIVLNQYPGEDILSDKEIAMIPRNKRIEYALARDDPKYLLSDMDEDIMYRAIMRQKYNIKNYIYDLYYPDLGVSAPRWERLGTHIYRQEDIGTMSDEYAKYQECKKRYDMIHRSDELYINTITIQGTPVSNIPPEFMVEVQDPNGLLYAIDATEPVPSTNPFSGNEIDSKTLQQIIDIRDKYPACLYRSEFETYSTRIPEQLLLDMYPNKRSIRIQKDRISNLIGINLDNMSDDDILLLIASYLYSNPDSRDQIKMYI